MGTVDLSRYGTDFRKHYAGVRMQQGRALTDEVFNDAARIDAEDMRRTRVDVIGAFGSPDDGFLVVPPTAPLAPGGPVDFSLAAGTLYLGGLRLEQRAAETFALQKDWLNFDPATGPAAPSSGSRIDLVWMEAWQQPVAAEEDSELFEAALGSADTAMNVRTMRRIFVEPDVQTDQCAAAWAAVTARWTASLGTMTTDMELATAARLQVTYTAPASPGSLCSPPVAGGYLGAENQAIRVQLVDPTHYTWGFDNASPLYRVQVTTIVRGGASVTQIKLLTVPKDAVHWPLKDQVVEILPWSAALPNGETLAELSGHLARVTVTYNPDDQTLEIDTPLPAGFGQPWKTRADQADFFDGTAADDYFFMRVWNRGDDAGSPPAISITNGDLGSTGLHVTFHDGPLRANDFWIIAARPATPDQVVPWLLESADGAPPHGVKRYRAPLGLIRWTTGGGGVVGQLIHDCRRPFLPLTKLRGCCTVTVGDGVASFGMFTSIQKAINALPAAGGVVCVLPGTYDESITIQNRSDIVVHGCDARSRVRATDPRLPSGAPAGPLPAFLIVNSKKIAIERLSIESGPRSAVDVMGSKWIAIRQCVIQMRDVATTYQSIFVHGDKRSVSTDVVIEKNLIDILPRRDVPGGVLHSAFDGVSPPPSVVRASATRGGVQIGGGCERVRILGNVIRGGIWNGITLGSVLIDGKPVDFPDRPGSQDPCNPCKPLDLGEDVQIDVTVRIESAGDLYDITIAGNVIEDMGANGIGVVRFFNLAFAPVLVAVHGLSIEHNTIRRCVRREISPPSQGLLPYIGYGGIALAVAHDLRITDNEIVSNGVSHLEPVCGVFAILVEHLELDRNHIASNGPRVGHEPGTSAKPGARGGVWIWKVVALSSMRQMQKPKANAAGGLPAAAIRDNVIVTPLGRALTIMGLGPMVVSRNRLASQGTTTQNLEPIATTVLVLNLGIGNEWNPGLFFMLVQVILNAALGPSPLVCHFANILGTMNPSTGAAWPQSAAIWGSGKVLVSNNQISCDVLDRGRRAASAVLVASLDDVGILDNQCEINTTLLRFFTNVAALAGSVRLGDNRLSESWRKVVWSGWSMGVMNVTTGNQSTHCIHAGASLPAMAVNAHNLHLVHAFCPTCP